MAAPLIRLRGLCRDFMSGEQPVRVLRDVDLEIAAGEMLAIVGASGSGKSTLMNILGCLDRPTAGQYLFDGEDTAQLAPDDLARLRREHFGFIFQRYHLLSDLTALGNVETPAIYAGTDPAERRSRAARLLQRLGLGDRMQHRPGQLSGGQQQRVSIARALMNGGNVILADEPTGALDRQSGQEVMAILRELNAEGHTVIIVTHDMQVAEHARRVIEISDGRIIADRSRTAQAAAPADAQPDAQPDALADTHAAGHADRPVADGGWRGRWSRIAEGFRIALLSMKAHPLRTALTMLGIVIGIAAVVSVVALGTGSQQKVLSDISSIATNTIDVMPGAGFGDQRSAAVQTLVARDAELLARQYYADSVTPTVSTSKTLRYRNVALDGTVSGVGDQFFRARGYTMAEGRAFDAEEVTDLAQAVVIDDNTRKKLFGAYESPVGAVILLGSMPVRVIGVTAPKTSPFGSNDALNVWIPYTTAMYRLLGQSYLKSITVRVRDDVAPSVAEAEITRLLTRRHGVKDFFVINTDTIRQTIQSTSATLAVLIAMIAVISLAVGGIGVMNIMLVSVSERTREIGVRMAVGARQGDIMRQFLIEAVLVCLLGGIAGVAAALGFGIAFETFGGSFSLVYSKTAMLLAVGCSSLIGIAFGYLPARNAAALDPVEALARE